MKFLQFTLIVYIIVMLLFRKFRSGMVPVPDKFIHNFINFSNYLTSFSRKPGKKNILFISNLENM